MKELTQKQREHLIDMVKLLAGSLAYSKANYYTTLGGIVQHASALMKDERGEAV